MSKAGIDCGKKMVSWTRIVISLSVYASIAYFKLYGWWHIHTLSTLLVALSFSIQAFWNKKNATLKKDILYTMLILRI